MFKEYPCVMQEGNKDCGACCLLTIIRTYGGNVSLEYLRELTRTSKEGTNAFLIMSAAESLGFTSRAVRGSVFDLEKDMFPCIAHVIMNKNMGHFIVIHNVDANKKILTIADPAVGRRLMSYSEFLEITTNQFILFTPTKKIPNIDNNERIKTNIKDLCIENKNLLISIFIFSLICVFINIISSYNFKFIIDNVLSINSKINLKIIFVSMLFLTLIKVINNYIRNYLFNYIEHILDKTLIQDIFKHIISLPYLYYKNRTTGEVISRINDLGEIRNVLSNLFLSIFVDIILVVFVFITLLTINIKLSLISLCILLLYLIVISIFNPFLNNKIRKIKEKSAMVNSYMYESINNIDTIKGLNIEDVVNDKFNIKYSSYINDSIKFNNIYNIENLFKELIDYIGVLVILFIGSILVLNNKLSLSDLITFNSLLVFFLDPIKNIINLDLNIKKTKQAYERINDLYTIKNEDLSFDEKYTNNEFKGNIKIKDLTYSYDNKNNILNKLSLNIKKGDKVLITGKSGSGKSTLVKIIMKYFNIDNNRILIDDKDINFYNVKELRNNITYVSQMESLYNDTLYNNVTLKKYIDYDEFINICKITKVDEIINRNPLGSSFLIEENGFNLSGGERQRIMLARTLVKDSEIYIFDESLSQIDIEKEREILKDLFKKYKNKTFIVISHRFDNKDLFSKIFNMKEGKIIA